MLRDEPLINAVERLNMILCRLTLTRSSLLGGPVSHLARTLDALCAQDILQAAAHYHEMTAALITAPSRRISGSLFTDHLLWALLEQPHAFSTLAAQGLLDAPAYAAMRQELSLLGELSTLDGQTLAKLIGDRLQELKLRPRQARDTISLMTAAAWAGSASRLPTSQQPAQGYGAATFLPGSLNEGDWLDWAYDAPPVDGSFVSDEALEEIYRRLLQNQNWSDCIDDLWNFFACAGCGPFLRDRLFCVRRGALVPLPTDALPEQDELTFYEEERAALTEQVIHFMRGERNRPLLLTGGPGTGKTTLVLNLARELPEVRLVTAGPEDFACLDLICQELSRQPLRFLLHLDDAQLLDPGFAALRQDLQYGRVGGENQLILASAQDGDDSVFAHRIHLGAPTLKAFIAHVEALLGQRGLLLPYDSIQNACIDAANNGPLNYTAAARTASYLSWKKER